ncbi:MAG: type IV pilus secretin PilQ [Proteobacteria bacterium]|nr:type IV pilus secretin PilQ [Pseudomonadota bacterium]MBS0217614.1 type IV pilus secretin PilQ [Pseudomonadota bacterium]
MQFIHTKCSGALQAGRIALLAGLLGAAACAQAQVANQPVATKAASTQALTVDKVDFKRSDDGSGKLILGFSGDGVMPDLRNQGNSVVIDLGNARVPATLQKFMNVSDFATPVDSVDAAGNRLVLNTHAPFESMAYQRGREYIVEITPKPDATAVGGMNSIVSTAARTAATRAKDAPTYTGRPVNFNFQDVPVRTVLQLIAETAGLNIVASDTTQGNITLRLQNVPWDKALDVILKAKGLDKRRDGNVIWVAPQSEIAKSEQDKEDARIALENRQDLTTEYFRINYHSATEIYKAITEAKGIGNSNGGGGGGGSGQNSNDNGFLSPRGRIVADGRTNTLMISDIPKKVTAMRALINEIDRPVDQVVIESRIVIATETFARDLGAKFGIGFGGSFDHNKYKYGVGGDNTSAQHNVGGVLSNVGSGLNFNQPAGSVSPAASIGYSILGANFSLDLELSAMQEEGRGEILANPRIFTTNQRESVIQQGSQIGYVTVTSSAGGAVLPQVQFKDVLLELRVTPTITNDDRVFLNVKVTKDDLDSWLNTPIGNVPIIAKRAVDTAVLMDNGQTVVIGGVYEFKKNDSVHKVPFLGDLPVIGSLFRQKSKSNQKAELLVFLTPRIIRVKQTMH